MTQLLKTLLVSMASSCGTAQNALPTPSRPASRPAVPAASRPAGREVVSGVFACGRLANDHVTESSGVVASRRHAGVFWTHNDGGGKHPLLFAFSADGRDRGEFAVTGARFTDWEDIAIDDEGHLFLADIGDNDTERESLVVHRIDEPDPERHHGSIAIEATWRLRLPGKPRDCEGLFVWRGHGYLVTKVRHRAPATIYRFALTRSTEAVTLEKVVELPTDSPVTAADIAADGKTLAILSDDGAWLFEIGGDVASAARCPHKHAAFRHAAMEGCCLVPQGLLVTTEAGEILTLTPAAFRD